MLGWLEAVALRQGPWNFGFLNECRLYNLEKQILVVFTARELNFDECSASCSYRADLTQNPKLL
jgi:hypothetical protein